MSHKIYATFPSLPGVYLFKNAQEEVLYIGKALSLKNRVSSYFHHQATDWKIDALIKEHETVEYILTNTEIEASLLEAELIKSHQPKYNILLKSGQPFVYILFTAHAIPTIKIVRNKNQKGLYFGPFLHKQQARAVYHFLIQTFRLNLCNKKIAHGCLDYHIGTCPGNCLPHFDPQDYLFHLQLAQNVLNGKDKEFTLNIQKKIAEYSNVLAFEKAQRLSNYLDNLYTIFTTIKARYSSKKFATDICAATTPHSTIVDVTAAATLELQKILNSKNPVNTIDCFDISHFQGKSIVGSCIRFTNGKPDKNKFRRFKIYGIIEQNDYAALQEIVTRRYALSTDIPDLILIDGGKGQLSAVKHVFSHTKCVSLAKKEELLFSDAHPHGFPLDVHTDVGKLLISLRDYAHHFAITYHRLDRKKQVRSHQTAALPDSPQQD
ncbi:MAG: GIY-YIG nuclease family protein [Candidatus Dependentiae bacterium]|nr:GIY-YIG nuclease family protein [Candidatus Dependentiae bacterium]